MECITIPRIEYRNFCERIIDRTKAKNIPLEGQMEVTFRCNLKCVHCYVAEDSTKKELTFPQITDIIDQIHQEGCLWLCLTGGEPLMRSDFLEIYSYAKRKGFLVTLFTNGTLITSKIADYLREYPPFMIDITLNGITAETYEGITRVPGSFQKCLEGIDLILERNLPLTLKSNGMILNRDEILKIKEHVKRLGKAKYRFDSLLIPKLNGSREPCRLRLSPEEIIDIEYADDTMREQWRGYFQDEYEIPDPENLYRCGAGVDSFCINPYGELQLCPELREPSFDLHHGSFREGFHRFFPKIRSAKYKTESKCKDCEVRHLCPQCPARAILENGEQEAPVEYFCALARKRQEMKYKVLKDILA
ncbi:MAG: radical SAM protein [Candidatus Aminicenantaceae bacterium]